MNKEIKNGLIVLSAGLFILAYILYNKVTGTFHFAFGNILYSNEPITFNILYYCGLIGAIYAILFSFTYFFQKDENSLKK